MKVKTRIAVTNKRKSIIYSIREKIFDYEPVKQEKAGKLIDKLKMNVMKYQWMLR